MAETINKIFSKGFITNTDNVQKVRYNRDYLISKDVAKELNTYLNFGIFPTFADTMKPEYKKSGGKVTGDDGKVLTDEYGKSVDEWIEVDNGTGTPGVRSIFNRAGAVLLGSKNGNYDVDVTKNAHEWRIINNVPLMDSPETRRRIRKHSGCSVKELVDASAAGMMGRATYAYSDFMYCKHLGKVPNNYMITLRRFPLPVDDFIGAQGESSTTYELKEHQSQNASQIGCMVTWMGVSGNDLNSILKYNVTMPFTLKSAEEGQGPAMGTTDADSTASALNGMFSIFDSKYREQYMAGQAGDAANQAFGFFGMKNAGAPPYKGYQDFRDANKVYGPVDGIKKTYMRSNDGINFEQKITLVFEYELKSYNGINPRQAMLDLISNILNVTYTTGSFFGGSYRATGAHQSNVFANLNIFKCRGGFTDFVDAFAKDLSDIGKKISGNLKGGGFKEIVNQVGGMMLAGLLNSWGRPAKAMYNSLLSPAPIGFWHVTIGNPKHPIMTIGNMVITNTTIEHMGPLGLDDFPTGLKVTVELDRGKPRDLRDIEKLYMQGNDRVYHPMGGKVFDMYHNAELYKNRKNKAYNPIQNVATIDTTASVPTIKMNQYTDVLDKMKKYFGTKDSYSMWVPAVEQEYGSSKKKPSTKADKSLANQ